MKKILIILSAMFLMGFAVSASGLRLSLNNVIMSSAGEISICNFDTQQSIYLASVYVTGEIEYTNRSGYVRLLLRDAEGHDKLVYQSFPDLAINGQDEFGLTAMETSSLNGFVPVSLVAQVNNCSLSNIYLFLEGLSSAEALDNISYCTVSDISSQEHEMLQNAPTANPQSFVDRLNDALEANGALWRAKETSLSQKSYEELKGLYGGIFSIPRGLEYYAGGIFPFWDNRYINNLDTDTTSLYPKAIDWRNRHNAMKKGSPYFQSEINGWSTPPKQQLGGTCWAFGPIGHIEMYSKLYRNTFYNFDLSEQDVVTRWQDYEDSPSNNHQNVRSGYYPECTYNTFNAHEIINEESFPFDSLLTPQTPTIYSIKGPGVTILGQNSSFHTKIESVKRLLQKGPLSQQFRFDYYKKNGTLAQGHHIEELVGYFVIKAGDLLRISDSGRSIPVPDDCPLIGQTAWIFKNSYGENWGENWGDHGYCCYFILNDYFLNTYSLQDGTLECSYYPMNEPEGTDIDIINQKIDALTAPIHYDDKDNDGYYWWGIGPKPATLPSDAQADYDDSDWTIGPADENGFPTILCNHDLYIKDNAEDAGFEANITATDGNYWTSPDIWVRNDSIYSEVHENPQSGETNYVYVRVHNRGQQTSPQGSLKAYWRITGTNLPFPSCWDGSALYNGYVVSGQIPNNVVVPPIAPGDSVVVRIPWQAPRLDDYVGPTFHNNRLFGLMAVVETAQDTVRFSATNEGNASDYVLKNSNVAMKNVTIVLAVGPGRDHDGGEIGIRDDLILNGPYNVDVIEVGSTTPQSIFDVAEVQLTVPATDAIGLNHNGFENAPMGRGLIAKQNKAELTGIESGTVGLKINHLSGTNDDKVRTLLVRQKDANGKVIGGETFIINPIVNHEFNVSIIQERSDIDITLTAVGVNEEANYVWSNSKGKFIATGRTITQPIGCDEAYTVQVTAKADGLRAYAQTIVDAEPLILTPNPATDVVNASYTLPQSNYMMCIYDATTMQLVHSRPINGREGNLMIDVSGMTAGLHIVNITDANNIIVRTGKFIKK